MREWQVLLLLVAGAALCASAARSQDSQSLGDNAARQARLEKQQKEAKTREGSANSNALLPTKTPRKIVTNDDIPEHVGSTLTTTRTPPTTAPSYVPPGYDRRQARAEQLKNGIQAQKDLIASIQHEIDKLSESIQHAETCIADCTQRNERQLESMQAQLAQQQKRLEDLQERTRKQGFGSAVCDP